VSLAAALAAAELFLVEDRADAFVELRDIGLDLVPDDVKVEGEVGVGDNIAEAGDSPLA